MIDGTLIILLDDIQYGRYLPRTHTGVEAVVAIPRKADIAIGAIEIAIGIQQIGQGKKRSLIHHSMAHIAQSRLGQPGLTIIIGIAAK